MRVGALALLVVTLAAPVAAQDRDGDRVVDALDLCPDAREGDGALFRGDGCPDTDGDHDGIVDDYDVCPTAPETVNGFLDLDGCPDSPLTTGMAVGEPGPDRTRIGCWDGTLLVDVRSDAHGSARLVPRADGPTWLGTAALDCYAGVAFDGRQSVHCATSDGAVEATLAMRVDGERATGMLAIRSGHGLDRRPWSGTALPAFDRRQVEDAIAAHQADFQACYQRERQEAPSLAGQIVVRLTVATSGEVEAVAATADSLSPGRPAVAACVVAVVDAWALTEPPRCAPVTTSFRIAFTPE